MNMIVGTSDPGFPANGRIGRQIAVGDTIRLRVAMSDPRCVMTTIAQGDLPNDADVLRTLVRYNSVQVGAAGRLPCAGVYAVVESPGTLRTGSRVTVA